MDHTTLYITVFYFLTYRLAILLLGGVSIFLGYRLFIKGFDQTGGSGPEMSAKAGKIDLTLKNAAPGIFFAAFGTLITIVILMGSPPQFDVQAKEETAQNGKHAQDRTWTVRSRDAGPLHDQLWNEDYAALMKKAEEIVTATPDSPDFLDTLASIYFLGGEYEKAETTQKLAVEKAKLAGITSEGIAVLEKKASVYGQFTK